MPSQCPLEKAEHTLLRISLLRILLLLFLVITAPCPSFAARELDGFNINIAGTATITGEVHAAAVQPWDGQIIIGGNFTLTEMVDLSEPGEMPVPKVPGVVRSNLARLNNDGSVDTTFAPEPDGPVYAIVIEQDRTDPTKPGQSRIYIGGDYGQIAGVARSGLARLGAAGIPDSFAPAAAGTVVNVMLLQPNRRVVVGGTFAMMDGTACSNLAAISIAAGTDGDLVQTFSGGTNDAVHALLLQEGYLVVGGSFTAPRKHLARFDPEDLLDGAFSAEPEGVVRALALQPDGMILVGGDFTTISTSLAPFQPRRYLARLTSEGQLDSFDPLLEEFEAAGVNRVASIAVQPDGKILAAGRFTKSTGDAVKPQQYHLARFQLNGAFDPGIDTKSNDAINVIVLEPNGRFLVGGKFTSVVTAQGVRARTGLARFYFHGGLDDDGAPFPPSVVGMVRTLALHPDGSVTIGGDTTGGPGKTRIAKLDPDLNLVPGYGDGVLFNHWTRLQSLRADGKHLVGGWFTDPRVLLAQLTKDGTLDTFTTFLDAGPLLQTASSWIEAAVLLPKVSRTSRPVGTMASEGMMYLALTTVPKGRPDSEASHLLVRVTATGALDPTFGPFYFDHAVETVTLQDDGKILVGGDFSEKIVRLHSNGDKDTDFQPWRPDIAFTRVDGITVLKDGNIIVNGDFRKIVSPDSTTTKPWLAIYKLRSDGSLDETFHPLIKFTYWDASVQGVTVLNDQTMILHGLFDQVNGLNRTCIVRVSQKGEVVGPNPLLIGTEYMYPTSVVGIGVQPDGKILAGGSFDGFTDGSPPMNRPDAKFLTRMSNIFWGTEEVVVAPGGSSITWLRGGTGPELWQVWFEEKSDAPGAQWEYLGAGVPVVGGWMISLPAPEAAPKNGQLTLKQNRYVRARGYGNSVGLNSGNSTLVESVRQYYLKEPIKVRAEAQTKVYGDDNPASYTAAYFDAGGEPIVPAAGTFFGTPTFSTPRTPTSPVGNYGVTADVSGMSSPIYSFIPEEGTLTVTKRSASVEPDDVDRVYGQAVAYGGTLNGFLPGDNVTATYSHAGGNTVAGSPHIISATLQPAGVLGNYDIAYGTGELRFSPKDASVRPTGQSKNYGDPMVLTGTLEGFLPGDNVTATYSREAGDTVAGSPYSISATLEPVSVLGNYNITYHPADLTLTKKDASVTPADLTKVYGEPVELSGTLQGFLASDNVTATYSRVAGNTVAGSPYSISATLSPLEVLDNYNITYNTGNLTFTKKDASVTPAPLTKVYGEPVELSGTLDGFLAGDNVIATYSREPGNSVTGSPYSISATLDPVAALDNYNITYNTADFTITKKSASVTPDPATKEYGSTAAEIFTGTLSGFLAADNVTAAYSRAAGNTVAGGPYTISATLSPAGLLGNYDITYNTADFTITKKAASVTPNAATKEYGSTAAEVLTGALSGFLDTDNVTAAYSRAAGNTVAGGPYTISATLSPAGLLGNYDITYNTADFTITKKAASVTPNAATKEYGSTAAEVLSGALSGFLDTDNVTAAYSRAAGNTVAGGPYTISATLSPADVLGNYDITYNTAGFTVTKKTASVTPDIATRAYGSTAAEVLTGTLSGFVASDGVTAAYSREAGDTVAGSPYTISATLSPAEVLDNYDITYNTAYFSIGKRAASVTPNPATKVYGSVAAEILTGTLSGFLAADNISAAYSRTAGETVAGSPYTISATLSPASLLDNYDITYITAPFSIVKKPASVIPNAGSKVYGTPGPDALSGTLTGFLDADGVTASYSRIPGETAAATPYAITATLAPAAVLGNYDISYGTAGFTILKKAASVTPADASKEYGSPDPATLTGSMSGFLPSDGVTASYSRVPGETVAGSPYAITATLAPAAVLGNYDITYGTAGFSIAKKAASVTPVAASKEYGSADPEPFTGNLSGFLPSDGVTASYTRIPGETSAGSPYAISATLGPAEVLTNYDISYNTAGFVIGKKAATVTAVSATKVYGEADPALLGEGSGFLAADLGPAMVTLNSSRPPGENAGAYVLTPVVADGGTGLLGNYNVTLVPGSLAILKAPLTITAQDKSRTFGAPDPEFTATYSGLVGSDTPESLGGIPAFSTTADMASPSGTYPIVPALGTITSTNYEFSFVNGILTVLGGAPQSITFNPMRPKTYGDGDFDPGARASSDLPVSYASSAPAIAAVVGEKIRVLAPGNAEITASQGGNAMFAAAEDVTRGLVVNPPPWNGVGFDGSDDFVEVADAPQLNFGSKNGFSIETWLYLDGSQHDGTGLLSKGEGGDPWSGYQLILHQNRIAAEIAEGTVTVGPADGLAGSSNLADGRWHHVAVAVDRVAATATLYLDGRVEAEVAHAALRGSPDNAAPLLIGRERSGSRFFKGRIDELRLWDSVRSREEIRASASQIIDPLDEPHVVAYFHFDEGDAGLDNAPFATAPERTSYAANGTLRNFGLTGTGSNWISSGAFLPLLETSAVGSITSDGATAGGNVYPNYYPATETGLCWGTSPDPGETDSCSSYGSEPGPFTGAVSGLDPGTTYHLRGYAKNQIGTAYGNDVTFQTARLDQIITFGALEERVYGDEPFLLNGSSSGGLALTYTSSAADVAEVAGDQVRIKGAGSATITAWQAGNATYNAAPPVAQSFVVQKRPVTVTADNQSRAYLADNPLLTASYQGILAGEEGAVTGLPLLSTAATPASPVGRYPITAGLGTLSAANYRFVFSGGVLTVRPAAQQITFNPMRPKTFGDGDFDPGATASSALPVAYASAAPGVAAVAGNRLKVVAPGTAAITASQSGSEQFDAAQNVTRELVVNPPPWNGLKFDGSDDLLRVADGAQLAFGSKTGFTLESWLYLDGAQPEGSGVLSKGEGGSAWSGFNLFLHQDRIAAEIGYGADSVGIADGLIGSSTLNDGQWHHVALSVDRVAATASLYLDGRLEARLQNPLLGGSPDNLNPLQIGVDRSGSRFLKGRIDELRLWGSARSREEIRGSVSRIIDPQEQPDLAAYFHLDEGDAGLDSAAFATAPERTAHAADGALLNFTLDGADSNWVRSGAFLPLLETAPVTLITSSAATGGGTIYPNYYPATDYGLCWSRAPNPSLSDSCSHSGSGTGPFLGLIAGLTPGATYHARGFATNRMGTAYGNDVTFQAARLDQSISFGPIGERTYGDPGFPLVASASSSLPITYASSDSSVAVVENGIIIPGGAGRAVITASQGGDQTYNAAAAVAQPFVVNKKQLTVSADAKSRAYRTPNPPFTVSFHGFVTGENSGVVSGAAQLTTVASLDSSVGSYPIVVGVGSLSADNYRFLPVNGTLTVFQSCQEIIFPSLGDRTYGDPPVEITASSCSGLGLSFASSNPLVATVSGNLLTITGAGSSVITASQRGSGDLEQAPDVSQTLVVHKRGQVIAFPPLPQKLLGDDPLLLAATASSGLPVSYASSDPAVAAVRGSTLTIAGTGTAVITARQEGSANFHPALPASQPFTAALEGTLPTLRLSALPSGSATASPVINVTGSAQDVSGITSLTVNDADLTGSAALFSSAVPLTVGENSITVSARDGAGNVASETLSVTLDATAPAIAVAEPADNSVTDQSLFTAKGTVPAGSTVTMAVNGAAPQPLAVTSGTFIGTGYLQAGLNTVELKALLSGRSALAKRSLTLAAGSPPVAITDPGEDLRTEADATLIRGRVGTRAGLTVRLEVNGAAHTPAVEGGVFQQQVAMDRAGEYRITVTASDSDGNSSGTQRNIIKVDRIAGDLDRDGVVDIGDAIALLRISLGIDPVTDHAVLHGDVAPIMNGVSQPDGKIGVGDVLVLLRKIVGLIE